MEPAPNSKQVEIAKRLSLIGFWIIGIVNNYTYVVILSAAYDLLDDSTIPKSTMPNNSTNSSNLMCYDAESGRQCNSVSTGVISIANILPSLVVKVTLSWCLDCISYHIRVGICIILNLASLLIIASSYHLGLILLGVVFASIGTGFGEITFLSLTAMYGKSEIAPWSSGTGAAGIVGSLSYLFLTFFLSPRTVIYLMVIVPFIMGVAFWGFLFIPQFTLLKRKLAQIYRRKELERTESEEYLIKHDEDYNPEKDRLVNPKEDIFSIKQKKTWKEKITQFLLRTLFIRKLLRYMCPLFIVYVFEYMINQGLFELLYYKNACIDQNMQYRVYQFLYQFGVFISRSSVIFFRIKYLWLMSFLQAAIFVLFYLEAEFTFIPFILITFCVILFEGLLGGATYANAFYRVRNEIESKRVEFSMGVVSTADTCGITLAGFLSIAIHNSICSC